VYYYFDTNICIYLINGRIREVAEKVIEHDANEIKIPAIVVAELMHGAEKSMKKDIALASAERFLYPYEIIPFDENAAAAYGKIKAALERAGTPIGANDLLIAATVMSRGGVFITHNTREFARVPGMFLEDWTGNG
jgi:tRNA(fMet)-specific endonuclease VapC